MTEVEKIAYTKGFIDKLADGINPLTNEQVSEGELVRNPRISRCFSYVSEILRTVIENGGLQYTGPQIPFAVSSADGFQYSEIPINVTELGKRINALRKNERMDNFHHNKILNFLTDNGYLRVVQVDEKTTRRTVTELGRSIGIIEEIRYTLQNEQYLAVLYTIEAQRFIIEHLNNVLATPTYQRRKADT